MEVRRGGAKRSARGAQGGSGTGHASSRVTQLDDSAAVHKRRRNERAALSGMRARCGREARVACEVRRGGVACGSSQLRIERCTVLFSTPVTCGWERSSHAPSRSRNSDAAMARAAKKGEEGTEEVQEKRRRKKRRDGERRGRLKKGET